MKAFFGKYSYTMVKMFITQVAVGLFGAVIAMAMSSISENEKTNDTWLLVTGILSALFFLFLLYTTVWEIGAKDRISIDLGKLKSRPYLGFLIGFIANGPNIIIATVYTVCWFSSHGAAGAATDTAGVMRVLAFIIEGMYYGILAALKIGGQQLFVYWWAYFAIIIPGVLVSGIAYILGSKNVHFTKIMDPVYPESDREPKKKLFERRKDD